MATHSSILPCKIPWTERSLVVYGLWGCKESDMTEHAHTYSHLKSEKKKKTGETNFNNILFNSTYLKYQVNI